MSQYASVSERHITTTLQGQSPTDIGWLPDGQESEHIEILNVTQFLDIKLASRPLHISPFSLHKVIPSQLQARTQHGFARRSRNPAPCRHAPSAAQSNNPSPNKQGSMQTRSFDRDRGCCPRRVRSNLPTIMDSRCAGIRWQKVISHGLLEKIGKTV